MICKRCIVTGRVQGVWYRDTTRHKATSLGVKGHARNLPDGTVEVLACGEAEAVGALCDWLWEGSPMSEVARVTCSQVDIEQPKDFAIA